MVISKPPKNEFFRCISICQIFLRPDITKCIPNFLATEFVNNLQKELWCYLQNYSQKRTQTDKNMSFE